VKPALIEHRPWLLVSIIAAIAYYFLRDNQFAGGLPIGGVWLMLMKGAGVGFLALYTWRRTTGVDGVILVVALALSAAADIALELSLEAGGALLAASHVVALGLYLRNRRTSTSSSQKLLGAALLVAAPAITYLLSGDLLLTLYAVTLGAMAAAAWTSRFPRYRVGIGAVLFVASDWLIFSEFGTFDLGVLPEMLIWPLYYAGQFMIATGVVQTLRGERPKK